MPCAAYVNFKEPEHAKTAVEALNGKPVLAGGASLRIDYYQRANKFLGGMMGLDRNELIQNTHFRVLFIKGIKRTVSIYYAITETRFYNRLITLFKLSEAALLFLNLN